MYSSWHKHVINHYTLEFANLTKVTQFPVEISYLISIPGNAIALDTGLDWHVFPVLTYKSFILTHTHTQCNDIRNHPTWSGCHEYVNSHHVLRHFRLHRCMALTGDSAKVHRWLMTAIMIHRCTIRWLEYGIVFLASSIKRVTDSWSCRYLQDYERYISTNSRHNMRKHDTYT